MKNFQELYDMITEKQGYDKTKWNQFKDSLNSNLRSQFFELFEQGYSEREIAQKLFRADIAVAAHRNTKFEIKTALYSELLKFKPSNYNYSPFQQAYYKAQQQLATFKTLKGLGKNSSVIDISSNLLKRSMTYELTNITVEVSLQMCMFHSDKTMDNEQIEKFSEIYNKYFEIQEKEKEVELLWAKLISISQNDSKENELALKLGEEYINNHPLPKERIKSYKYYSRYYFIQLYCLELRNDLNSFENVACKAYQHFCNLPYEYHTGKIAFLHNLIDVNLRLNRFSESIRYIDIANDVIKKGESNWFIYMLLKLKTQLHIETFLEANETYTEMIDHRNFDHQPNIFKVQSVLLGSYIQFLNVVDNKKGRKPSTQFINKHLKFLEKHQNDLEDLIVPILLSSLLFSIHNRDFDRIESNIQELKKYTKVYLKSSSPNYRSHCFIRMLLIIPLYNYNLNAIHRHVESYLKKLEEKPPSFNKEIVYEVIPYEKLWSIILDHLRPPKRIRKSNYDSADWVMGKRLHS